MGAPHPGPVAAMPMLPSYREAADRAPIPGNLKLYTRFHEKKLRKEYIAAAAVGTLLQIWKISFSFALIHQCFSHIILFRLRGWLKISGRPKRVKTE